MVFVNTLYKRSCNTALGTMCKYFVNNKKCHHHHHHHHQTNMLYTFLCYKYTVHCCQIMSMYVATKLNENSKHSKLRRHNTK